MLADPRQVEHERLLVLELDLVLDALQHGVAQCVFGRSGEVVVPVRAPLDLMGLPVSCECGRATGSCSDSGALISVS